MGLRKLPEGPGNAEKDAGVPLRRPGSGGLDRGLSAFAKPPSLRARATAPPGVGTPPVPGRDPLWGLEGVGGCSWERCQVTHLSWTRRS